MPIVFIGNSSAARECYWLLREARAADPEIPDFKGFLAWKNYPDNLCDLSAYSLGNAQDYAIEKEDRFVIAIGAPALRAEIYEWLKGREAQFFTLKHPDVYICPSASIGEANIFTKGCAVLANASIGNANFFNGSVICGHDVCIGNANVCNLLTAFSGKARVGDQNLFSPLTVILQNARIGSANTFAPGCVVYRGCGDHCHMAGNPGLIEYRHKNRARAIE